MTTAPPAVSCTALTFGWPDGSPALDALDVDFATGRTGLVGANGSGKSTLLRLIAGDLRPGGGAIATTGDVGYLPQRIDRTGTVADLLGVAGVRSALRAIEAVAGLLVRRPAIALLCSTNRPTTSTGGRARDCSTRSTTGPACSS